MNFFTKYRSVRHSRKHILLLLGGVSLLLSFVMGCQKNEYDNPYGSSTDSQKWAPGNLTVVQTSLKTAHLTWTQPDPRIDSFRIESRNTQGAWHVVGYAPKTATSFIDSTFVPDVKSTVEYRVIAMAWKNLSGANPNSVKPVFPVPLTPFVARDTAVRVRLNWMDIFNNEDTYKIEKKENNGSWVLCADTIKANHTVYYDNSPALNAQICYRISVKAAGVYSETTLTEPFSSTIAPPNWLTLACLSQTSCRVEWRQADLWTTGYQVDRQVGTNAWEVNWLNLDATKTTFTDANLPVDQEVRYRIGTLVRNAVSQKTELKFGFPQCDTIVTSNANYTSVKATSGVNDDGGSSIMEWGVVYGLNPNPTDADQKVTVTTTGNTGSVTITGLDNSKTYYMRTYAINRRGIGYGKQKMFTSAPFVLPKLSSGAPYISSISYTSAYASSYIPDDGGTPITEAGFVCSISHNPTLNDIKIVDPVTKNGSGSYDLGTTINNLSANQTYYIRPYAKNSVGLVYGLESSFKTLAYSLVQLDTLAAEYVDANQAMVISAIGFLGGDPNAKYGFVYGTSPNPTLADNVVWDHKIYIRQRTYFESVLPNLISGQTYYVRTVGQNQAGVVYGPQKVITTPTLSVPIVAATTTANLNATSVTLNSGVFVDGGKPLTDAGFVYSTSQDPTVNDQVVQCLQSTGYSLSTTLKGLPDNTKYWVRAYARNAQDISYGPSTTFTTQLMGMPILSTSPNLANVLPYSVKIGGTCYGTGGDPDAEGGVVYGDQPDPTINDHVVVVAKGYINGITALVENLQSSHQYYFRLYVKNQKFVAYSNDQPVLTTVPSAPIITSSSYSAFTAAVLCYNTIKNDCGSPITECGYYYSLNPGVTTNDTKVVVNPLLNWDLTMSMTFMINNLLSKQRYYLRSFVTNALGTSLGDEKSVTTL